MGNIHFIGGEKGGVGKSFTARLLAQYFIDSGIAFRAFDTDRSHETFSRFYGDYSTHIDANEFDSLDELVEYAEDNPHHQILVDLAAQTFAPLARWMEDSDAIEMFLELDYKLYFWHVMDDGADSMFLLEKLMRSFPDTALQLVVVKNLGRGGAFEHFDASPAYQQAMDRGASIIELAELQPTLMRKIDFNSLSFWAASNSRQAMSIVERKRVGAWLKKHYALIDDIMVMSTPQEQPAIDYGSVTQDQAQDVLPEGSFTEPA
ncbi:MAG: mobilization protein [Pseudomonadales bacterium]|nr:mobilization protein [Pseudomonadales bacterium]